MLLVGVSLLTVFVFSIPFSFLIIYMNTNRTDVRVDLEIIPTGSATKMQAKLNQWITKGELIKYEIHTLDNDRLLFNICRVKSTGE
jgi:hypothetical protein